MRNDKVDDRSLCVVLDRTLSSKTVQFPLLRVLRPFTSSVGPATCTQDRQFSPQPVKMGINLTQLYLEQDRLMRRNFLSGLKNFKNTIRKVYANEIWNFSFKSMVPRHRAILYFVSWILLHFSPERFNKCLQNAYIFICLQFLHASFVVYLFRVLLKASSKE